jgi:predicted transglutaminase-like cysteine proteinase
MTKTYLKGLLAATIFAAAQTAALAATPANMLTLGKTNPPIGHYEYCKSNPNSCSTMNDDGPMQLTEARWKTLLKVNYTANSTIER